MKVVIQRVKESSVEIDNKIKAEIGKGLLVLIGISQKDNKLDVEWLVNKVLNIRIFNFLVIFFNIVLRIKKNF